MRFGVVVAMLGLTSCQLVFSLEDGSSKQCVESGLDDDNDGVDDGCDSCPGLANIQHDEDHDEIDDSCDNCPGAFNPGQEDTTENMSAGASADGIGDPCDPRPDENDARLVFRSFAEESVNQLYDDLSGQWEFDGESAVFTASGLENGRLLDRTILPEPPFIIQVGIDFETPFQTSTSVGVHLDVDTTTPESSGVSCVLSSVGAGDHVALIYPDASGNKANAAILPAPADPNFGYRITAVYDRVTPVTCLAGIDGALTTTETELALVPAVDPGELALLARRTDFRFVYFEIYKAAP